MEKRNSLVKKPSVLLAAALVLISTGMASAATRQHARSSTNVQDAVGPAGYAAPHEVPENGGAASMIQPGSTPNWRQKTRTREEVRFLPLLLAAAALRDSFDAPAVGFSICLGTRVQDRIVRNVDALG